MCLYVYENDNNEEWITHVCCDQLNGEDKTACLSTILFGDGWRYLERGKTKYSEYFGGSKSELRVVLIYF